MNNSILFIKDAGHGETPPCPDAIFKRGDVVLVRNSPPLANFPREAVVVVAIPPGFSPDWAKADLLNQPRPLLALPGMQCDSYLIVDPVDKVQLYLAREKDLTPTGKTVEIGTIKREGAAA